MMCVTVLMFAGATALAANTNFGEGDGPIIANVVCSGTEAQLTDCVFNITHGCAHNDDVALSCVPTGAGKQTIDLLIDLGVTLLYYNRLY